MTVRRSFSQCSAAGPHRQGLPLGETTASRAGTFDLRVKIRELRAEAAKKNSAKNDTLR